jgi:TRAP transporter TAXI family solute receptor
MKQKLLFGMIAISVIVGMIVFGGVSTNATAETKGSGKIIFMTGSPGGSWQAFGGVLKNLLGQKMSDVEVSVLPGGSGSNVVGIELGKANMGLCNSFVSADAKEGRAPFKNPTVKMRHLVTLWPQWFQLFVRADSDIKTVNDLRGKRIVTLKKGSAGEESLKQVLSIYGLSYKDLAQVNFQSAGMFAEMVVDGRVDAAGNIGPVPASYYVHLTQAKPARLISLKDKVEALHKRNSGFIPDKIPAGSYKGVEEDVVTVSNWVHIMVSADMDSNLAYRLTKVLLENYQVIRDTRKGWSAVNPKNMAIDLGIEYHSGSLKYFKEARLIKQ